MGTLSFMMTVRTHHGDTKAGVAEQKIYFFLGPGFLAAADGRDWHMG